MCHLEHTLKSYELKTSDLLLLFFVFRGSVTKVSQLQCYLERFTSHHHPGRQNNWYLKILTYRIDFPAMLAVDPVGRWAGFGGVPSVISR
jgi:hypothetical protein